MRLSQLGSSGNSRDHSNLQPASSLGGGGGGTAGAQPTEHGSGTSRSLAGAGAGSGVKVAGISLYPTLASGMGMLQKHPVGLLLDDLGGRGSHGAEAAYASDVQPRWGPPGTVSQRAATDVKQLQEAAMVRLSSELEALVDVIKSDMTSLQPQTEVPKVGSGFGGEGGRVRVVAGRAYLYSLVHFALPVTPGCVKLIALHCE